MRGLSRGTPTLALKFRCVRIITPPGWIVVGRGGRGGVRRLADEVRAKGAERRYALGLVDHGLVPARHQALLGLCREELLADCELGHRVSWSTANPCDAAR